MILVPYFMPVFGSEMGVDMDFSVLMLVITKKTTDISQSELHKLAREPENAVII